MGINKRNHFKVKKLFSSLLLSYLSVLMVPFVIVFFLVTSWNASTEKYYKEVLNNSLTEGRKEFEKRLEIMQSGAFSMVSDSSLSWVSSLEGLFPGETSILSLIHCNEKFNEAFADTSTFYDYCVVCKNEFVFRKKGMYRGNEFFYQHYRNYSQMTYEEWISQSLSASGRVLFPMQEINIDGITETAMTYSYPVRSYLEPGKEAKAVIQFLLTKEDISEMFSALGSWNASVYIYGTDGSLLADITSPQENESEPPLPAGLPEGSGCVTQTLNGEEYMVFYQNSSDQLIFTAVLPKSAVLMGFNRTKTAAWVVLAAVVLFEILLGWRFAWRYSGPVRNVITNLQRLFSGETAGGGESDREGDLTEYEFLEESVNQLMETNQSMETILQEKGVKEKINFLTLLFNGEFHTDREIAEEAGYVGLDLGEACHYVIVLYTGLPLAGLLERVRSLELLALKASYAVDEHKLALLFAGGEEERKLRIQELTEQICSGQEESAAAGIGRVYTDKTDLCFSFRQACYCAEKAQMDHLPAVVYETMLLDLNIPWYPAETETKLIYAAKSGDAETVRSIFAQIEEENIRKGHLPQMNVRILVSNILFTLLTLYENMAQQDQTMEAIERIERAETLPRALELLRQQFLILCEQTGASRNRKEKAYYERLKSFMEENFADSQFGVPVAAEHFGLSENYFSIFFKEIMGISFSSYLEKLRLEKARELIEQGEHGVEQISQMAGYNSSATFRRAFKRAYGVTPSAWKK